MGKFNWNCEDMQWKSNNINTTYITFGTLSNKNIDVLDLKNGNPKLIFSFFWCSVSANLYGVSSNKGI